MQRKRPFYKQAAAIMHSQSLICEDGEQNHTDLTEKTKADEIQKT